MILTEDYGKLKDYVKYSVNINRIAQNLKISLNLMIIFKKQIEFFFNEYGEYSY